MKLAMVGFGQAGGKILDKFLEYDRRNGSDIVRAALAVNTAKADLVGLENVPEENRVLIGQSRVKGHGVGADNELGSEVAEEDIDELVAAMDDVPAHEVDAFLIIAGLGGGSGSGGGPVLARHLKRIYTEPVYALGILPSADEGVSTRSTRRARSRPTSASATTCSSSTTTPGGAPASRSRRVTTASTRRSSPASVCCSARARSSGAARSRSRW